MVRQRYVRWLNPPEMTSFVLDTRTFMSAMRVLYMAYAWKNNCPVANGRQCHMHIHMHTYYYNTQHTHTRSPPQLYTTQHTCVYLHKIMLHRIDTKNLYLLPHLLILHPYPYIYCFFQLLFFFLTHTHILYL